jgi:hypothetical protein
MMNTLSKNLIASAVFASFVLAGAIHAGVASASDDVQHKLVEIKAVKGHDLTVWVEKNGDAKTIILDANELQNKEALLAKLAELDEDTRNTVLKTLEEVKSGPEGKTLHNERVFVMNKGEGQVIDIDENQVSIVGEDAGGKHHMVKQIFIDDGSPAMSLKGHADAITQLIDRGEFSREELDKIQAAIDAKR